MKVRNIYQIKKLDPEEISLAKGEKEREKMRKKLINKFLMWSSRSQAKQQWKTSNNEDRIIIKRQYAYFKALTVFGCFANFAFYNCFFTGIYNFRKWEVLNLSRWPFVVKFALSSAATLWMCSKLWQDNVYDADLYKVALKYRPLFDKKHIQDLQFHEQGKEQSEEIKNPS